MSEAPQQGHNQLRSITERINNLEDSKKAIAEDIRDVYAEAKGNGFNPKALRVVVRKQRADAKKADADKKLTSVKAMLETARQAVETLGENYTSLRGSLKTLESNLENEASRMKPFPTTCLTLEAI